LNPNGLTGRVVWGIPDAETSYVCFGLEDWCRSMSPIYEYVFQRALSLTSTPTPRVLDYGCGRGEIVRHGRSQGLEFYGVDRAADSSERPEAFRPLVDGAIPFEDNFFDVVVSNQVFEHVADPPRAVAEISRVLKPGGRFLALFPDDTSWFEGHVGLYFVHWMSRSLAHRYMMFCHRLGFGYYREGKTAKEWADFMLHQLETDVFYHSPHDLRKWWSDAFGAPPVSLEQDFMAFRLEKSPSLGRFATMAKNPPVSHLLSFVCRKRAGIVWLTPRLR
jgi:SAM-dependent methyltransferase